MALLKYIFLILFCSISLTSFGQGEKYLVLDKPGRVKRIRFYVGDELIFKLTGDKHLYKDIIEAVSDTSIRVRGAWVPVEEIKLIKEYKEANLLKQAIYFLPRAGIIYFLADTFNPVFTGGEVFVSRSGVIVGGSLIAGSLILRLFAKRTYRINNYRTLKILETF